VKELFTDGSLGPELIKEDQDNSWAEPFVPKIN
jgi:hypothetical protein